MITAPASGALHSPAPAFAAVTRPHVVIVMGVAGAGKTTVGRALAESLGWRFHDADDFHPPANVARMRAGLPLGDAERAPWLDALHDIVARDVAAGAHAVLACSALKRRYREVLVPRDVPAGAVRVAYLRVSRSELERRLTTRVAHFASVALLDSQLATLEEPASDEGALVLDGGRPVAAIVAEIRRTLGLGAG